MRHWSGALPAMSVVLVLLGLLLAGTAHAQPAGQRFVSIAFHDVVDRADELDTDAVTTRVLTQFFDWLKGSGWTAISLDDVAAAARGARPLPDKAILITFDDGYRSLYTHVYPLLQVYRFPIVSALVGSWMEGRPDGTVLYGDRVVPRRNFLTWGEARELQASGLVEFASHSYDLHRGVLANPQGNMVPAAITWRYDPATQRYETDAQYRARIRADLQRSRQQIAANLGRSPRALVWPFGRYTGPALAEAKAVGFSFALTLEPEPAYTSDLFAIHRYFPAFNPTLADLARNLRFDPDYPANRRVACLNLDALAAAGAGPEQDTVLGRMIEGVRSLGANVAVIDGHAGPLAPGAPLGEVYFPSSLRPMRADLLSRAVWQLRTRAGVDAYMRLPLDATTAAVGEAAVPTLFGEMRRHAAADGLAVEAPAAGRRIVADLPGDIRARRQGLDPATLDPSSRLALSAFRGAAAIDPRLRLMLVAPADGAPPDWADMAMLGPNADASATTAVARRLRGEGWLRPDVAGRLALGLPAQPGQQVEAIRQAQRLGATAFALCPQSPLPPPAPLAAAFSASTYPYRP
jgi:poly-beta-1,6-N-acetyl-D-glucosamine N-deacetylase